MTGYRNPLRRGLATVALAVASSVFVSPVSSLAVHPGWQILSSDDSGLVARWNGTPARVDTIPVAGVDTYRLTMPGAAPDGESGTPAIPVLHEMLALPDGAQASVSVAFGRTMRIDGLPSPGPTPSRSGATYEMSAESYAAASPSRGASIEETGVVNGVRIMSVTVRPAQFLPGADAAVVYSTEATLTIRYEGIRPAARASEVLPPQYMAAVLNSDRVGLWQHARPAACRAAAEISPFASGTWMRVMVNVTGMYRLDASDVVAADSRFEDASISSLGMFAGVCRMLPVSLSRPRDEYTALQVVRPLVYDVNSDGKFNDSDYLLFYGNGPKHWWHDTAYNRMRFEFNRYSRETVYWLSVVDSTALHAQTVDAAVTDATLPVIDGYWERSHVESDIRNFDEQEWEDGPYSGIDWEWRTISGSVSATFQETLHDMVGSSVQVRVGQLGAVSGANFLTVRVNDTFGTITEPEQYGTAYTRSRLHTFTVPVADERSIDIDLVNIFASDISLDFYELSYLRRFALRDGKLDFFVDPHLTSGPDGQAIIQVSGVTPEHRLFDVTDGVGLVEYDLPTPVDGAVTVQVPQDWLRARHYVVTTDDWLTPVRLEAASATDNLHAVRSGVEYLIVTHPDFETQARRLAEWRETSDTLTTAVVTTQDVYDEFSMGMFDPTAIRDFLSYAYSTWRDDPTTPSLRYVLLLGDGQYDFRNVTRFTSQSTPHPGNWLPPYEDGAISSDDWFGIVAPGSLPNVMVGRICARNEDDARYAVDKIIAYESGSDRGAWQNEALFVADDEYGERMNGVPNLDEAFVLDSENLIDYLRDEMVVRKLYTFEYLTDGLQQKPAARNDLLSLWSRGAVLLNYIGHGNPVVWAHEHIFMLNEDLPSLTNGSRLPVLTALTCSAAHFDDPETQSMAELLLTHPGRRRHSCCGCLARGPQRLQRRLQLTFPPGAVQRERPQTEGWGRLLGRQDLRTEFEHRDLSSQHQQVRAPGRSCNARGSARAAGRGLAGQGLACGPSGGDRLGGGAHAR